MTTAAKTESDEPKRFAWRKAVLAASPYGIAVCVLFAFAWNQLFDAWPSKASILGIFLMTAIVVGAVRWLKGRR